MHIDPRNDTPNDTHPVQRTPLRPRSRALVTILTTLAVLVAGCGGGSEDPAADDDAAQSPAPTGTMSMDATSSEDMSDDMDDMDMDMAGSYGEPADPSEADRTVEVNVDNDLAFEPAEFAAEVGEVITFEITNTGDVEHEFVLGDEEAQEEMAEMMDSGDDHAHSGEMSNAVTIHVGESAELTWRFTDAGTVLIGCHVPGHWEAGMKGTVEVG